MASCLLLTAIRPSGLTIRKVFAGGNQPHHHRRGNQCPDDYHKGYVVAAGLVVEETGQPGAQGSSDGNAGQYCAGDGAVMPAVKQVGDGAPYDRGPDAMPDAECNRE